MLIARRTSSLAIAAAASALLLLMLLAATLVSRDRVRIAQIGCGGASVAVGARHGSVALQLRRRHTFGGLQVPAGWRAFTTSYSSSSPLAAMCIRQHGERWLLPGLWLGAGRDTYVHYADVLFPPWLTIPACLILPSIWYHRHRHRQSRGFAVLRGPSSAGGRRNNRYLCGGVRNFKRWDRGQINRPPRNSPRPSFGRYRS